MRGYRHKQAHDLATARRKEKARPRIDAGTWAFIKRLIRKEWSSEQISGWMKNKTGYSVSHERIYQHILQDKQTGGDLYRHLRCRKKRKKRYGSYDIRGQIKNRVRIDERPAIVDSKRCYGNWEVDTIIGRKHQQVIVSLAERKSRLSFIQKVDRKTSQQVSQSVIKLLRPGQNWVGSRWQSTLNRPSIHPCISSWKEVELDIFGSSNGSYRLITSKK